MESSFVILNGNPHPIRVGQSIMELLSSLGMEKHPVVVELNEQAILPAQFSSSPLNDGDRIEIVSIVAGG